MLELEALDKVHLTLRLLGSAEITPGLVMTVIVVLKACPGSRYQFLNPNKVGCGVLERRNDCRRAVFQEDMSIKSALELAGL